jgi:transposase
MKSWEEHQHFAGLDWASDHHDLCIVNRQGKVEGSLRFSHESDGWLKARDALAKFGSNIPVAVETTHGIAIEQLQGCGCIVYPVHPFSAKQYRQRKAPSGVKDDQLDAWSLADALRVDGHGWKALGPEDPLITELRLLCRDEIALIEERTALVNQLRASLREYYPAAIEAFEDWTHQSAWQFIIAFPTPEELLKAGKRRWEKFLHSHKMWRPQTAPDRMEIFARAAQFCGSAPVTAAKRFQALALAKVLCTLEAQLRLYRERIEDLFKSHPDSHLFGSLPGAGAKLAPRLLGEIGDQRERFSDASALQCYAGTAPVTIRSGQIQRQRFRRNVDPVLRASVHLWADMSRKKCTWAETYYQAHRANGQSHACALRCLGQRWLKILWKMWQSGTPYDEAHHTQNQVEHGSWILQLKPS